MEFNETHEKIIKDYVSKAFETLKQLYESKKTDEINAIENRVFSIGGQPLIDRLAETLKADLLTDECCYDSTIKDCQQVIQKGIASNEDLLDAIRRYELKDSCPAFKECPYSRCEGFVWCSTYHLGKDGSHSFTSTKYAHLGKHVGEIPKEKRKEIMLEIFEEEGYKVDKK